MNEWVKYVSRSYQQIKSDILSRIVSEVPEMTDHTESNLFVKMVSIWAALTEMLGYYIDNIGRESHMITSRLYANMIKHAFANDYRVHGNLSASVNLYFSVDVTTATDITIPTGTIVETEDNIVFFTVDNTVIRAGTDKAESVVSAVQGVRKLGVNQGTTQGVANEVIVIDIPDAADGSVSVRIGGVSWDSKQSLAYSTKEDLHFVQTVNEDKKMILRLGDGFNGAKAIAGQPIVIDYTETIGEEGNILANRVTNILSFVNVPSGILSVTNLDRASGGSGVQNIESIRHRIPRATRTLQRAVTRQDYIDVTETLAGVARAGVSFNCGKIMDLYIIPEGGGLASDVAIQEAQSFIDEKRMITTQVNVKPAGEVRLELSINASISSQFQRIDVSNNIKSRLAEFLSFRHQDIGGEVHISDIYEIIETTDGVINSKIEKIVPRPFARRLGDTEISLDWSRFLKSDSDSTTVWRIQMNTADTYQLFRDGSFIGVHTVGDLISMPEIDFTVRSGPYSLGDEWTFTSYPYFGNVVLLEPSLPVSLESDITITVA